MRITESMLYGMNKDMIKYIMDCQEKALDYPHLMNIVLDLEHRLRKKEIQ
jgi:hypothetical protein